MRYGLILLPAAILGCGDGFPQDDADRGARSETASEDSNRCASQGFATVALGQAVAHVRTARLFAERSDRRQALAELEIGLLDLIQQDPDTVSRDAALLAADPDVFIEVAEVHYQWILSLHLDRQSMERARTRAYRNQVQQVVDLLDPSAPQWRRPDACASDAWRHLHAQALRAEAL